jgi:hypothetical protein
MVLLGLPVLPLNHDDHFLVVKHTILKDLNGYPGYQISFKVIKSPLLDDRIESLPLPSSEIRQMAVVSSIHSFTPVFNNGPTV